MGSPLTQNESELSCDHSFRICLLDALRPTPWATVIPWSRPGQTQPSAKLDDAGKP